MIDHRLHRFTMVACVLLASTLGSRSMAADANSGAKGDTWETTSQMTMPGMPMAMPASKHTLCSPKVWREPPGAGGQHGCTNSDMKTVGNKTSWTVQCPDMTGVGEITRDSPDAYTGTIRFTAPQGAMTVNLTGHKTGECDNPQ